MHFPHHARGNVKYTISDFPKRAKAIREARGLKQEDFLPELREASVAVLGAGVRRYSQSLLSRLESGKQEPSLEDVAVLAACDPEGRGELWLGFGVTPVVGRVKTVKSPQKQAAKR